MNRGLGIAALLSTTVLLGCTVAANSPIATPAGAWQNWQVQVGTSITSPPSTYPNLVGALQAQGTQATGLFSTTSSSTVASQILSFSGSFDATTDNFQIATFGYGMAFAEPTASYTVTPITLMGGCIYPPSYTGPECLAIASFSPAVGVEIAPLSGTFSGILTDNSVPSMSGTATLTLTQSTAPNASGQFPLSGTITFPSGSNIGTAPLGGTVAGEGIALSDSSAAPNSPTANVTASASPDGSQITVSNLLYSNAGPGAVFIFTGTLKRQ